MRFWLLFIISIATTNLIKNANSVGDGGKESKLYKTFDEIFGKGWDDESNDSKDLNCRHVKEEVQDGQAPNTSDQKNFDEILKQKFDEIYDENWSEDENNSAPKQDESVDEQLNESNEWKKIESDQQKREIIQKFREMKEEYKKNRKYPNNEWVQIESKISNGLGVSRTKLYKWIKKLGLREEKISKFSGLERREIVEEFIKMKNEFKQKGKYSKKEWNQNYWQIAKSIGVGINRIKNWKKEFGLNIKLHSNQEKREKLKQYCELKKSHPKIKEFEIAESLNIGRNTLWQWKRELKNAVKGEFDQISPNNVYSDQQKREILKQYDDIKSKCKKAKFKNSESEKRQILKQFDEIKSKCKKAKLKNISMNELDEKIAKKLGLCASTIYEWKRKFGLSVSKKISDATKIEILKKYAKIKGKNPKMRDLDIVDLLNISISSLTKWKAQFSDESKHL